MTISELKRGVSFLLVDTPESPAVDCWFTLVITVTAAMTVIARSNTIYGTYLTHFTAIRSQTIVFLKEVSACTGDTDMWNHSVFWQLAIVSSLQTLAFTDSGWKCLHHHHPLPQVSTNTSVFSFVLLSLHLNACCPTEGNTQLNKYSFARLTERACAMLRPWLKPL